MKMQIKRSKVRFIICFSKYLKRYLLKLKSSQAKLLKKIHTMPKNSLFLYSKIILLIVCSILTKTRRSNSFVENFFRGLKNILFRDRTIPVNRFIPKKKHRIFKSKILGKMKSFYGGLIVTIFK
jgi:hypothetical protein